MYYVLTFVMFQFGTMETDISNWTFKTKSECDKVLESLKFSHILSCFFDIHIV